MPPEGCRIEVEGYPDRSRVEYSYSRWDSSKSKLVGAFAETDGQKWSGYASEILGNIWILNLDRLRGREDGTSTST